MFEASFLKGIVLLPPASEGWRKVMFSLCSLLRGGEGGWGGYPPPLSRLDPRIGGAGRVPPHPGQIPGWVGGQVPPCPTPHPGQIPGWGGRVGHTPLLIPPPHHPGIWHSIASTCYAAGGMPLAFTQEDFLVLIINSLLTSISACLRRSVMFSTDSCFSHCCNIKSCPLQNCHCIFCI